jgi:alkylation response protein AidB-like acyl-CoA dehydrogenase
LVPSPQLDRHQPLGIKRYTLGDLTDELLARRGAVDIHAVLRNLRDISSHFAAERTERQQRRALVSADFAELRDAGFLLTGVPVEEGGVWQGLRRSTRPVCETLRILAHGDPSVALVCAMHPSVLAVWLTSPEVLRHIRRHGSRNALRFSKR